MARVAHDLNDQLTVICGFASMGATTPADAERTTNYFALIDSAGQRAAVLTRELIALERSRSERS